MKYLITGAAGFIGFHVCKSLLDKGFSVIGADSINNYYDQSLKKDRVSYLSKNFKKKFIFNKINLASQKQTKDFFSLYKPDYVIHLAAQAGVRYSIKNPYSYLNNNLKAFLNILENCRYHKVKHLVYASTSSVYGANTKLPFDESDSANHPIQFYAATKRSNELMAHSYSSMFNLPTTGLRFFTVYGPWGRPDMALFKFTKNIIENKIIDVFNNGKHKRDFTYVDDIVSGIIGVISKPPKSNKKFDHYNPDISSSSAPYRILNIGNNNPVNLMTYISLIEKNLGKKAKINFMPLQRGDVEETFSDISKISALTNYNPKVDVETGVKNFIDWYKSYYGVNL